MFRAVAKMFSVSAESAAASAASAASAAKTPCIKIDLNDLEKLSPEHRELFIELLKKVKQERRGGILHANAPYVVKRKSRDGNDECIIVELEQTIIAYKRKNKPDDIRFAILEGHLEKGKFGRVYMSGRSLSLTNTSGVYSLSCKIKKEGKKRVIKVQKDHITLRGELLAEKECRLTKKASPELCMKELVIDEANKMSALIMHYLPGEDLFDCLAKDKTLTNDIDRLRVCIAIAEDIQRIHRASVIHRDLKPENARIHANGGLFNIHIYDFGLATEAVNPETEGCGSPSYAAPEMFIPPDMRPQPISFAADVYSLCRMIEFVFGKASDCMDDIVYQYTHKSQPFNDDITAYPDSERHQLLNSYGFQEMLNAMREINPSIRMPLPDVIAKLKDMLTKLLAAEGARLAAQPQPQSQPQVNQSRSSVLSPVSLFTAPQTSSAASAAADAAITDALRNTSYDLFNDDYGYNDHAVRHNAP